MKKFAIVIAIVLLACCFVSCSKSTQSEETLNSVSSYEIPKGYFIVHDRGHVHVVNSNAIAQILPYKDGAKIYLAYCSGTASSCVLTSESYSEVVALINEAQASLN